MPNKVTFGLEKLLPYLFDRGKDKTDKLKKEMEAKEARYQQIIGQQSYEIDWLKKKSGLK